MKSYSYSVGMGAIDLFKQQEWVDAVKATKITRGQFNNMEGYQYEINIKVVGKAISDTRRYRNRLFKIITNSSWLDDNNTTDLNGFNQLIEGGI